MHQRALGLSSRHDKMRGMLFLAPELDTDELAVCARIDTLRVQFDRLPLTEWVHPLWAGRLWRLMVGHALSPAKRVDGAPESSERALDAFTTARSADASYRRAMTLALRLASDPDFAYSIDVFKQFHYMLVEHHGEHPGCLRHAPVSVRHDDTGECWYTPPRHEMVPELLSELASELNRAGSLPSLIRAAMAHLNFALIHPFMDANGRAARCVHTLVLARDGFLSAPFCSLDQYLGRWTQLASDVMRTLSGGNWEPTRQTRPWIRFCLRGHLWQASLASHRTEALRILSERVEAALDEVRVSRLAMPLVLDAALGKTISTGVLSAGVDACRLLASEHLRPAVDAGVLTEQGPSRQKSYVASESLLSIARPVLARPFDFVEPFDVDSFTSRSFSAYQPAEVWKV